jgi:hypothetical protein
MERILSICKGEDPVPSHEGKYLFIKGLPPLTE